MLKSFRMLILTSLSVGVVGLSLPARALPACFDDEECPRHQHCEITFPNAGHCVPTHGGKRSSLAPKGQQCETVFDCTIGQDCHKRPGHDLGYCVALPTR
jgi:hypothetical protein